MRRIVAMPAVERLLFAIGAIAIVMMAMTYTTRPGHKGLRNWAGDAPVVVNGADSESEQNRFLGVFSR